MAAPHPGGHFLLEGAAVMAPEFLVTVRTPEFTAKIVLMDDGCVRAHEKLRWCLGKKREDLSATFRARGWTARITPCPAAPKLGEP